MKYTMLMIVHDVVQLYKKTFYYIYMVILHAIVVNTIIEYIHNCGSI